ncbi:MAG: hypothetical protein NTZ28_12565 [Nitrospirae bacterium]|nr:hypothetical protein [Nitrospirota bacterium]
MERGGHRRIVEKRRRPAEVQRRPNSNIGGAYVVNLGKLTLVEVMADYDRVRKSKMYSTGSGLVVREILSGSSVAGYTAADDNLDVGIWDMTPAGKDQGTVLQMVYNDSRGQHDGGSYRGRSHSGD